VQGGAFYKKNAVVLRVIDKFVGEVQVLPSGAILQIDQEELQTVVPISFKTAIHNQSINQSTITM
jgi:hypothetical protein